MFARTLIAVAVFLCTVGIATPAWAGSFEIDPVRLSLAPSERSEDFTVTNKTASDITFSVRTYVWSQSPTDELHLDDTDDVLAFPETFTVPAHSVQRVRVGLATPATGAERTYRLYISQLPNAPTASRGLHLAIVTRVGIPLFASPLASESEANPVIANAVQSRSSAVVSLRNEGTIHLNPSDLTLTLVAADKSIVWKRSVPVWYVLAHSERALTVPIPESACSRAASLRVAWSAGADRSSERSWTPSSCGAH
jgi:fimbrial chaperone protein